MNRYKVTEVTWEEKGEPPTYEVRKNAGGPADDYDTGECVAVFEQREQADAHAAKLNASRAKGRGETKTNEQ